MRHALALLLTLTACGPALRPVSARAMPAGVVPCYVTAHGIEAFALPPAKCARRRGVERATARVLRRERVHPDAFAGLRLVYVWPRELILDTAALDGGYARDERMVILSDPGVLAHELGHAARVVSGLPDDLDERYARARRLTREFMARERRREERLGF